MKNKFKKISRKLDIGVEEVKKEGFKHPLIIPTVSIVIFFFLALIAFINFSGPTVISSDSRVVELYDNGHEEVIPTTATTVGQLIGRLKIKINPGDIVDPTESTAILDNGFKINIYRVHPVTIIENGIKKVFLTANSDPRVIAEQAGYQIYTQDYVYNVAAPIGLTQNIIGQEIEIVPATEVNLTLYGTQVSVRTHAQTVADLLVENKIKTSGGNNVLPALTTPISSDLQILVVPVGQKLISEQQSIPFTTQYVNDPSIPYGTVETAQSGANGLELVVEDVIESNGVTTNNAVQQVVINQPIVEIINRGTGVASTDGGNNITWLRSSSIGSSDYQYVDYIMAHESHWNPADVNAEGCIGLGQFCSPSKLTLSCPDWQIDAVCQLNVFNNYAVSRYGSWAAAASFWESHGWW
jgi:uncharacterized protein YabE (DUF348 family)